MSPDKQQDLAPGERELFAEISEILGATEMRKNGSKWRKRIRQGPDERLALRYTIEDLRDVPRWFTIRYQHNLVKIYNRWRRAWYVYGPRKGHGRPYPDSPAESWTWKKIKSGSPIWPASR